MLFWKQAFEYQPILKRCVVNIGERVWKGREGGRDGAMREVKACCHIWEEVKRDYGDESIEITFCCHCGTVRVEEYVLKDAYEIRLVQKEV